MLFDWLVVGQILAINPAHAVRGPKHVIKRGKTPVLSEEEARRLLASIKVTRTVTLADGSEAEVPSLVGLRDRALIGVMVYSFAGSARSSPCRSRTIFRTASAGGCGCTRKAASATKCPHTTSSNSFSTNYLDAAGIREAGKTPLFRSAEAGGTRENAQAMAAHESPRTTKLYDRTGDQITLDEVERIQI